jgi:hypothetical protein
LVFPDRSGSAQYQKNPAARMARDLDGCLGGEADSPRDAASLPSAPLPGGITVFGPGGGVITSVAPSIFVSGSLGAFDGATDYAGTSGEIFAGLSSQQSAVAACRPDATELGRPLGRVLGLSNGRGRF